MITVSKLPVPLLAALALATSSRAAEPVILSETAVSNLRIQTVEARPAEFTETLFAVGRIEPIPARKSVLSSRVAGRVVSISAHEGDWVEAEQALLTIESLQMGDPPPRLELRAPQRGMVMQSHTHLGKPVAPENELYEIIDLTQVYAVARLPEDQAGSTALGSVAQIRVAARPDESFKGRLVRYGSSADSASGTIDAYFTLENPHHALRPEMRAEFFIVVDTRSAAMSVPKKSIQSDGINRYVFVEDFDLPNAFVKTPVLVGASNQDRVEILRGLLPGDRIVTDGAYSLMFAGGGSTISLKEALDAAHGHEHNEDGSEMTAEQRRQSALQKQGSAGGGNQGPLVVFLAALSGLLFLLLLLSLLKRRHA